jgi:hypothetical protein
MYEITASEFLKPELKAVQIEIHRFTIKARDFNTLFNNRKK